METNVYKQGTAVPETVLSFSLSWPSQGNKTFEGLCL